MSEENIKVITDKKELYEYCENVEQLFDKFYLPLLDIHYRKIYNLQQKVEQLENIRKEAIEWCKCVINSKTTAGELPNGKYTDMGYCLDLAEPLLKILEEGDNKE